jgi:DNA processing protein
MREVLPVTIACGEAGYPAALLDLASPPATVSLAGTLEVSPSSVRVAIVGTREPTPQAADFAGTLAEAVVRRGGVVISGGAAGIDTAAHEGALAAGGRTWVVAPTGVGEVYPKGHEALEGRVIAGGGAMVWPFPPGTPPYRGNFLRRNGVLVALSQVLVIVQAGIPSGALNAAKWAEQLGRERWVVCPAPWESSSDFAGCLVERARGARALTSVDFFLQAIGVPTLPGRPVPPKRRKPAETCLLAALAAGPRQVDELVAESGLGWSQAMTALLTLRVENVLVEGPEGWYRLAAQP